MRRRPADSYPPAVPRWPLPLTADQALILRAWLLAHVEIDESARATPRIRPLGYDYLQLLCDALNLRFGWRLVSPFWRSRLVCSAVVAAGCAVAGWWPWPALPQTAAPAITPLDWALLARPVAPVPVAVAA